MTPNARLLTAESPESDLLAAAALAQDVGATHIAVPLTEQAREKALARQRARKLANVDRATHYEFDEAF